APQSELQITEPHREHDSYTSLGLGVARLVRQPHPYAPAVAFGRAAVAVESTKSAHTNVAVTNEVIASPRSLRTPVGVSLSPTHQSVPLWAAGKHRLGGRLDRVRGLGRGYSSAERVAYRGPARILDLGEARELRVRDHRVVDGAARDREPL